jgi:hypothetical protein
VAFVVIGGAGLQSHGQSYVTQDVDITPARSPANLARLAAILNKLEWRLVVDLTDSSQDVPVPAGYFTVASLGRQDVWNLMTAHGKLDITFTPSGFPTGYDELRRRAQCRPVANTSLQAPVAALEDIEHSKRVAGRPKDRSYLMAVGRLHPPPQIPRTRTP